MQIWRPVEYFSSANTPEGFLAKKRLEIFPYIRGDELITKPQSVQYSWLHTYDINRYIWGEDILWGAKGETQAKQVQKYHISTWCGMRM